MTHSYRVPAEPSLVDRRVAWLCLLSSALGLASCVIARWLVQLINLATNAAYYGRLSAADASPAGHALGWWSVLVPVAGGLIVGLMARYGSKAIRGHGIPEAMEQVLTNQSRVPARVLVLKPLSTAIAIGTGGPFGAEGPIIATGGSLGSLIGQALETTALERKTLLAAGAAAGMTAIFGAPVSSIFLAVELLLFELRPRSVIPVAAAAVSAMTLRLSLFGAAPVFSLPAIPAPGGLQVVLYALLGGCAGLFSVAATRAVYAIEDAFERLPVHWMWWPALGGLIVGFIGMAEPRTLGVGYDNIQAILSGTLAGRALLLLAALKFLSWSLSLGSGTSGGTLAPLFTVGGAFGALLGGALGLDPRVAGLVGMASVFTGASRAMLASVVFAFEMTRQPEALLPLLCGGAAAYLVSCATMRTTIMTEKIHRRGVRVPAEYAADYFDQVLVRTAAARPVMTLEARSTVAAARRWLASGEKGSQHQGFPVVDEADRLLGVVTRKDLMDPRADEDGFVEALIQRPPAVVFEDCTLRQARDHMAREGVGRLPVVSRGGRLIGILSRSDLLGAHRRGLSAAEL